MYLMTEVQKVYRSQGQNIHDKHFEVIIRKMMSKVQVTRPGDTKFLPGDPVDRLELRKINEQLLAEGKQQHAAAQCANRDRQQTQVNVAKSSTHTASMALRRLMTPECGSSNMAQQWRAAGKWSLCARLVISWGLNHYCHSPRRRESSVFRSHWVPAFAGTTVVN